MKSKSDFENLMEKILDLPSHDPQFLPSAEEVLKMVDAEVAESESLSRYRKLRERMGESSKLIMHPRQFRYTVHSA